ncbi:alpha/beta hydrolase family protein [Streptomyces triticiradicis]|uniref:Hydrolase n=1 Tax=Streptomyces triticiradicis TaxID=2651189 RepID=A0A7J5D7V2_9ACTN|nr:alpha/beta family hydrolase [Streptomyces triticiradicis]KAB1981865.1 hydrolase [Streptomyces triticiradicis]
MTRTDDASRTGETSGTGETVETDAGTARITWHRAAKARLVLAVSHGAGGGIEARDLRALAGTLPAHGVSVALVEQPWRVAGKKVAPAPRTLDTGWRGVWPALAEQGLPVISGGRSAGARVACRTAVELGAAAVLALSFPLHPPGKPERSRAAELLGAGVPTLVVQGGNDPFGRPEEFPPGSYELIEVPHADHGLAVPKRAPLGEEEALKIITDGVTGWAASLG